MKSFYDMNIISRIYNFLKSIFAFWASLSEAQKQKIIDVIVKSFDDILRDIYKKRTKQENR